MQHHRWVMAEVNAPRNQGNQFWQAVALVMAQFQGMMDGYNARVEQEGRELGIDFISMAEWLTLNTMGERHASSSKLNRQLLQIKGQD
jgi:hypothetical protein